VEPFDLALLLQSILMILVQSVLLHLLVRLRGRDIFAHSLGPNEASNDGASGPIEKRGYWASFWAWPRFIDYVSFLILFTQVSSCIVLLHKFLIAVPYMDSISLYTATLLESTLCMPQFYRNWRSKSTHGLSRHLVLAWVVGDAFKLGYFLISGSRTPFIVCAIIQIVIDIGVIGQIWWYKGCIPVTKPNAHMECDTLSRVSSNLPLKPADYYETRPKESDIDE